MMLCRLTVVSSGFFCGNCLEPLADTITQPNDKPLIIIPKYCPNCKNRLWIIGD